MPREDLDHLWDDKAEKIYDETYNEVHEKEMERYHTIESSRQPPRHWYNETAMTLACNLAEDAVDEYLEKKEKLTCKVKEEV